MISAGTYQAGQDARNVIELAKQDGRLPRYPPKCAACGIPGGWSGRRWTIEYHHSTYARPLEVASVCRSCHRRIHWGSMPQPPMTVVPPAEAP